MELGVDIKTDDFEQDLNTTKEKVILESKTGIKESGKLIEEKTRPHVPLREGALEHGFSDELVVETSLIELNIKYSALSKKGYDYSFIQHESPHFKHPIRGSAFYLNAGVTAAEAEIWKNIEDKINKAMQ